MLASPFESVPGSRCFRHLHPRAAEDSEVTPEDSARENPEESEVTSPGRGAGEYIGQVDGKNFQVATVKFDS